MIIFLIILSAWFITGGIAFIIDVYYTAKKQTFLELGDLLFSTPLLILGIWSIVVVLKAYSLLDVLLKITIWEKKK